MFLSFCGKVPRDEGAVFVAPNATVQGDVILKAGSTAAVSYTHLDVYKRQEHARARGAFGERGRGRHRRGGHGVRALSVRPARQRLTAEWHGAGLRRGAPQINECKLAAASKAKNG